MAAKHSNITENCTIDNQLVLDKYISLMTMDKTISKKISVKDSAAKPSGKPQPGDKNVGLEPAISYYAIEDGDDTEKGE